MYYEIKKIENAWELDHLAPLFADFDSCELHLALQKTKFNFSEGFDYWHAYNDKELGVTWGIKNDSLYFSQGVYVVPEFRRQGIATALKKIQIEHARNIGCTLVETILDDKNNESKYLQKKLGCKFQPIGSCLRAFLEL